MATALFQVIEETRLRVATERTDAILALEDAQQALELAQCILETVRQEPTSGRLVGQDEASRVRLELRAAEQRVKQLDDVLRELDDCAARSH